MYSIKNQVENTEIIKNSKFICILCNIKKEKDIKIILTKLKKEYKKATHYTYAYIIDNKEKAYDDGEPKDTAGLPILNILKKKKITSTIAVVIRYYGGTKLGTGRLVRAYSKACNNAVKKSKLVEYIKTIEEKIRFTYKNEKIVNNILKEVNIVNKKYKNNIAYTIEINEKEHKKIMNQLKIYIN